ncbi:ribosomal protein S18 acetylase RimI-like enzyme [Lachnospiraceae bacterium PFB1-21]
MNEHQVLEQEILVFLKKIDSYFSRPLSQVQDLEVFAKKLVEKGTLCYRLSEKNEIISLVAGYTDNLIKGEAYISLVGTLSNYSGHGLATELVEEFLQVCKDKQISSVHLYTTSSNKAAVHMYERLGFYQRKIDNELRPKDIHFYYCIDV